MRKLKILGALSYFLLSVTAFAVDNCWPGKILVQFKGDPNQWLGMKELSPADAEIADLLKEWQVTSAKQMFPLALSPEEVGGIQLRTWWKLTVPEATNLDAAIAAFSASPSIAFAQPSYIYTTDIVYNDPRATLSQQYGLYITQGDLAHDYATGSDSVIVAIVDTGVQYTHPDLSPNMWINPGEDLNGDGVIDATDLNSVDDDADGYVDNFYGADPTSNDGDPMPSPTNSSHGTHCAGIANAQTMNGVGVASLGFNCRTMAVRAGCQQYITEGYEGIEYAARKGAHVISLSWGGSTTGTQEQQVIDYAWNRNCVVLAAAGNDNVSSPHYPSALNNVISVASTNSTDVKSGFSNYGTTVDISAPGSNIMSTIPTNSYSMMSGTSMACPFAAGLAALIKSRMLAGSNQDVIDILLASADSSIYSLGGNSNYYGLLGAGRIDAMRAMEMLNVPEVHYSANTITELSGDHDGRVEPGESANLVLYMQASASFAMVDTSWLTIRSNDPGVTIQPTTRSMGSLQPGQFWNNETSPFIMTVANGGVFRNVRFTVQVFAQPGDFSAEYYFDYYVGWPELLIIDDDEGSSFETYYDSVATVMNIQFNKYDMTMNGTLPANFMRNYGWVIWITGNATSTIDALDQTAITAYLQAGGKLLMVSQNIPEDPAALSFLTTVVDVTPLHNDLLHNTIEGVQTTTIGSAGTMYLGGGHGAGNGRVSQSTVTVGTSATACYTLGTTGEACGVQKVVGNGKIVLFTVALEGISTTETGTLSDLLANIRVWLAPSDVSEPGEHNLPSTYSVSDIYPNPFNATASLRITLPQAAGAKISVYTTEGRLAVSQDYRQLPAGINILPISLQGMGSGMYFVRIATTTGYTTTRKAIYLR
ncbi:MAG: S8 family serine peptidase [bacterium]|nr:S8 family serine peptidase [bacterium]